MRKDMVFGVAVKTKGQFLSWRGSGKSQMDISLKFFCFLRVAVRTIHIDVSLSKMEIRIGLCMAVHAEYIAYVVDVLAPFSRVDKERANLTITHNLGNFRFAVAREAFFIRIRMRLRKGLLYKEG
ncbi:hypothetical protein GH140_03245 [bacterium]|nr:hypothetical protein [bacterium]